MGIYLIYEQYLFWYTYMVRSIVPRTQQPPQVRRWTELHGLGMAVVVLKCRWICHIAVANLN